MFKDFDSQFEEKLGKFTIKVLKARISNKAFCEKHRIDTRGKFTMTPQEELFAKFFSETAYLIKDMNDLDLQAYREELSLIALEARAKQTAVIEEDENRKKKRSGRKLTELEQKSLTTDETTTDAINAVNRRNTKLSKLDKVKASLMAFGMTEAEAEATISSRNIRDESKKFANPFENKTIEEKKAEFNEPPKPFVNPFLKKES